MLSPETVSVTENFSQTYNGTDKVVYSFYNISNRALLLTYTGTPEHSIFIDPEPEPERFDIYVSKTYNGKRSKIGTIYK